MVLTRSSKGPASSTKAGAGTPAMDKGGTAGAVRSAGAAFTSPADEERIRRFRSQFLSKKRTWRDWVSTFWAQVEVHSGAYMFDLREHVIFYTLFATIVYLVVKSLLNLILRHVSL